MCRVIPTKWQSYRDHRFRDVALPYVFIIIVGTHSSSLLVFPRPAMGRMVLKPDVRVGGGGGKLSCGRQNRGNPSGIPGRLRSMTHGLKSTPKTVSFR